MIPYGMRSRFFNVVLLDYVRAKNNSFLAKGFFWGRGQNKRGSPRIMKKGD